MNVQLSKNEIIDLIKSVPLAYRRYTPELEMAGEWNYNMDGPTPFSWYTRHLLSFSEEELYEFYLPDPPKEEHQYKAVKMPMLRRAFPTLKGIRRKHET